MPFQEMVVKLGFAVLGMVIGMLINGYVSKRWILAAVMGAIIFICVLAYVGYRFVRM